MYLTIKINDTDLMMHSTRKAAAKSGLQIAGFELMHALKTILNMPFTDVLMLQDVTGSLIIGIHVDSVHNLKCCVL